MSRKCTRVLFMFTINRYVFKIGLFIRNAQDINYRFNLLSGYLGQACVDII